MIKNLQKLLKEKGIGYSALIISPENRKYFTEFDSSDGFLLVSSDRAVFITDGRYIEAAENQISNCEVNLLGKTFPQIAELLGEMVRSSTKENLQLRVDAEYGACQGKKQLATLAKQENLDAIHDTVHEMAKDEARHGCAFKGLLDRYFS